MKKNKKDLKSLHLSPQVNRAATTGEMTEGGLIPVVVSTEQPALERDLRGNLYLEVLDHGEGSVDLSGLRKDNRVTLLESHIEKPMVVLGSVRDIERLPEDKIVVGNMEFSDTLRGQDAKSDFINHHREFVSVGAIRIMPPISVTKDPETGLPLVRLKWKLIDVSGVHEPADPNARAMVTRSASEGTEEDLEISLNPIRRSKQMTPEEKLAAKEAELKKTQDDLLLAQKATRDAKDASDIQLGEDKASRELKRLDDLDSMQNLAVTALGLEFGDVSKEIQRMKKEGIDPSQFRAWMVKAKAEKSALSADDNNLGLTNKEQVRFSLAKCLRAIHAGEFTAENKDVSFEVRVSRDADKLYSGRYGGQTNNLSLTLPRDITHGKARRAAMTPADFAFIDALAKVTRSPGMSVDQSTKGGAWAVEGMSQSRFIDYLNAATITDQLNITQLQGLTTDVKFAVLDAIQIAYTRGEHEAATLSDLTTSTRTMSAKLVSAGTKITHLLTIAASAMGIEMLLERKLALAQAIKRNQLFLYGTGKNGEPLGILVNSGVNLVAGGTNGLAPTVDNYINMRTGVMANNAGGLPGQPSVFCMNSVTIGKNQRTAIESGQTERIQAVNIPMGTGTPPCIGHRVIESNLLRSNLTKGSGTDLSEAIFVNPAEIYEGHWGPTRIIVDDKTQAATDEKITYIHEYIDYMLGHPVAVSIMNDLITT